eukprot:scaffold68749_cov54-Phaeocystis_antarctica.AAC.1
MAPLTMATRTMPLPTMAGARHAQHPYYGSTIMASTYCASTYHGRCAPRSTSRSSASLTRT